MKEYLDFAIDIAKYAGNEIKNNFSSVDNVVFKSDRTPVTEVDKRINHYLIEQVYLQHQIVQLNHHIKMVVILKIKKM